MLKTVAFAFAVTGSLIGTSFAQTQNTSSMQRGLFYENRPFGALAFIRGVYSKPAAQAAQRVLDLSQSQCVELPEQSEYWFLINHSDADHAGEPGVFAIKIYAHSLSNDPSDDLRVQRTGGFVDDQGRPLREFNKDPSQLSIGARDFAGLHDDNTGDEAVRFQKLVQGIGEWHAHPAPDQPSTWSFRRIFADREVVEAPPDEKLILGARLVKFTATGSTFSVVPIVFGFNPSGMKSFKVSISAPGLGLFDQATEVKIGSACNQPKSGGVLSRLFGN